MSQSAIITASPDVMSGTPVFTGTRVPVQTLLDYLKAGESIDDFLASTKRSLSLSPKDE